jgi:hypothetical protein
MADIIDGSIDAERLMQRWTPQRCILSALDAFFEACIQIRVRVYEIFV